MAWHLRFVLICSILIATSARFINLGYSDFQGDEVSAQNYLFGEERLIPFLLSRTIGPMQYIISYMANAVAVVTDTNEEFFVRLPFAVAGILSIFVQYKLCRKFFFEETALISTTLISISGLYIAFSRIVQYQSFVILFSLITVYAFLSYLQDHNRKKLIYIGLFAGIGLLFHYDSLSFVLPIYIVMFLQDSTIKKKVTDLSYLTTPFVALVSVFYLPFFLQPNFRSTLLYLANERIRSEFNYDSLYYSVKLMSIYHPKEYLMVFLAFTALLMFHLLRNSTTIIQKSVLVLGVFAIVARFCNVFANTALIYISVIFGFVYLALLFWKRSDRKESTSEFFVTIWFLFTFITYGLLFQKPLTHIYNFLTPVLILFGIVYANSMQSTKRIFAIITALVGLISISFNHQAFINTTPEYPWNEKKYLTGTMDTSLAKNQGVLGVFGFPYNRNWEEIGSKLHELAISKYKSNEKYRLSKYYVQGIAWDDFEFEAFVWVDKPQSFDRQPRPTQDVLAEGENYVIYRYKQPL